MLTGFTVPYATVRRGWHSFAQLNERFDLARRTHSISVYTEGMLAMETTLVGVIRVNPKQLLEEGIRRELVVQVARAMDEVLVFNKAKPGDLEQRLAFLAQKLDGFRRSFECASRERGMGGEGGCVALSKPPSRAAGGVWQHRHPGLRQHLRAQDLAGGTDPHHPVQRRAGACRATRSDDASRFARGAERASVYGPLLSAEEPIGVQQLPEDAHL